MNNLPIMPIRAKYADETAEGKNIDTAITALEQVIGDENSGLIKSINDLQKSVGGTKLYRHKISTWPNAGDIDYPISLDSTPLTANATAVYYFFKKCIYMGVVGQMGGGKRVHSVNYSSAGPVISYLNDDGSLGTVALSLTDFTDEVELA